MGPTWGPPGSCRPQMGSMLAPWTLLSVISSHRMLLRSLLIIAWEQVDIIQTTSITAVHDIFILQQCSPLFHIFATCPLHADLSLTHSKQGRLFSLHHISNSYETPCYLWDEYHRINAGIKPVVLRHLNLQFNHVWANIFKTLSYSCVYSIYTMHKRPCKPDSH